jgi:Domain of unknown function (DUF6883)
MALPNADRAVIDPAKIRDYLLAPAHPVGRFKARFFVSLGYAPDQWERLQDHILAIARSGAISAETATTYGRKFEVDGILTAPSGLSATVRTVWIIRVEEDFPRLVTVFPR